MLSVRLPQNVENNLNAYCKQMHLTKSQVVQEAVAQWLDTAQKNMPQPSVPDLSFLAPDDPIRQFIGLAKEGPSTDEWMVITRGEDWNKP